MNHQLFVDRKEAVLFLYYHLGARGTHNILPTLATDEEGRLNLAELCWFKPMSPRARRSAHTKQSIKLLAADVSATADYMRKKMEHA